MFRNIEGSSLRIGMAFGVLFTTAMPVDARSEGLSHSDEAAKNNRTFVRCVNVTPRTFKWNEHQVNVRESWLERPSPDSLNNAVQLLISFTIDGKDWKEHSIAHRTKEFLELKDIDQPSAVGNIDYFNYLPPSRTLKALPIFGGAYGNFIHYIRLKESIPRLLKLRVDTSIIHDHRIDPAPDRYVEGDVILSIDLSEDS